jgi:hypothetical protein
VPLRAREAAVTLSPGPASPRFVVIHPEWHGDAGRDPLAVDDLELVGVDPAGAKVRSRVGDLAPGDRLLVTGRHDLTLAIAGELVGRPIALHLRAAPVPPAAVVVAGARWRWARADLRDGEVELRGRVDESLAGAPAVVLVRLVRVVLPPERRSRDLPEVTLHPLGHEAVAVRTRPSVIVANDCAGTPADAADVRPLRAAVDAQGRWAVRLHQESRTKEDRPAAILGRAALYALVAAAPRTAPAAAPPRAAEEGRDLRSYLEWLRQRFGDRAVRRACSTAE